MSHGYFKIRLLAVSQQKGKINNTNPKPLNNNNNTASPLDLNTSVQSNEWTKIECFHMSHGYFKIRLVIVSQQKEKINNTNPKPLNNNNNTASPLD